MERILLLMFIISSLVSPSLGSLSQSFPFGNLKCEECRFLVDSLSLYFSKYNDSTSLEIFAINLCIWYKLQSPAVCTGIIKEFSPEIIMILQLKPYPIDLCEQLRVCTFDSPNNKEQPKDQSYNKRFKENLKNQSYKENLKDQSYKENLKDQSYKENLKNQSYKENLKNQSYKENLKDQSYKENLKDQSYKEKPKDQSYKESQKSKHSKSNKEDLRNKDYETGSSVGDQLGTILQLSDIHYDPFYLIGSDTQCQNPLCCRSGNGTNGGPAGYYGSLGCDSNGNLITSAFESMVSILPEIWSRPDFRHGTRPKDRVPNPDLIMWTGDATAHDVWEQSWDRVANASDQVANFIEYYYPHSRLAFSVGNHENYPSDQDFGPFRNSPQIEILIQAWGNWLTDKEIETFKYAGYYETILGCPDIPCNSSIKIISLNSDYVFFTNLFMTLFNISSNQSNDVGSQWSWLNKTLAKSLEKNQSVWIMSHSSFGDTTVVTEKSLQFYSLIEPYLSIIKAQFHGHTHFDAFRIVSSQKKDKIQYNEKNQKRDTSRHLTNKDKIKRDKIKKDNEVLGHVEYIAPSMTPFSGNFPSFRIYQFDWETFEIVDYYQYIFNLSSPSPKWELSYQASKEYNFASLNVENWMDLENEILNNSTVLLQFCQNYFSRTSNPYCSQSDVLQDIKCQISTLNYDDYVECLVS